MSESTQTSQAGNRIVARSHSIVITTNTILPLLYKYAWNVPSVTTICHYTRTVDVVLLRPCSQCGKYTLTFHKFSFFARRISTGVLRHCTFSGRTTQSVSLLSMRCMLLTSWSAQVMAKLKRRTSELPSSRGQMSAIIWRWKLPEVGPQKLCLGSWTLWKFTSVLSS